MIEKLYSLFREHPKVITDSRRIEPGCLFFALHGASFDGNRFALDALKAGAAFAVVDDPTLKGQEREFEERFFLVEDTLQTLQALARHHRQALGIPIIAIAGSNGKTTTKELTAAVLAQKYRIHSTRGNLNNHIGVPLTLLEITSDKELAVVEMGASASSEIALLCSIAAPDYGVLTNIGRSHLEGFGGPEGIRRGKGELYDYLVAHGGQAFIPEQDEVLVQMWKERTPNPALYFSNRTAEGVATQLEGEYNRYNIAAAMAVGRHFGVEESAILEAIAAYTPQNHRSQRLTTERNTLILDCYNANPSSMAVAIEHFSREEQSGLRKVMILGDMLELGAWSRKEHEGILRLALACGCELWLVGELFRQAALAVGLSEKIRLFASQEKMRDSLSELCDAIILIKGSHSIGLERCVEEL